MVTSWIQNTLELWRLLLLPLLLLLLSVLLLLLLLLFNLPLRTPGRIASQLCIAADQCQCQDKDQDQDPPPGATAKKKRTNLSLPHLLIFPILLTKPASHPSPNSKSLGSITLHQSHTTQFTTQKPKTKEKKKTREK